MNNKRERREEGGKRERERRERRREKRKGEGEGRRENFHRIRKVPSNKI
jgi:hypothetical protein